MFIALLWLTGIFTLGAAAYGYYRFRDIFHPLVWLGLLLSWPYCFAPLLLDQAGVLQLYLPMWEMPGVQMKFIAGIASMLLGALSVGRPGQKASTPRMLPPVLRQRIRLMGLIFAVCGLAAYFYTVRGAGGFEAVYSDAHGRSEYGSGYVRDLSTLVVPAVLLIIYANYGRQITLVDKILLVLIAAPLAFHGVISASRGTTYLIGITFLAGWYMMRSRRPRLALILVGGSAIAFLIFFLAANRDQFFLGSSFNDLSVASIQDFVLNANTGQEYVYGAGSVVHAEATDTYQWGALYVIRLFIRPIPKELWPTKYEDAFQYFGIPDVEQALEYNVSVLGWTASGGAAAGLVADLWVQFWWFMVIPLFLVGRLYGWTWHRGVARGGLWTLTYVVLLAHAIFLTQQDLDALLNKILLLIALSWSAWRLLVRDSWRSQLGVTGAPLPTVMRRSRSPR